MFWYTLVSGVGIHSFIHSFNRSFIHSFISVCWRTSRWRNASTLHRLHV